MKLSVAKTTSAVLLVLCPAALATASCNTDAYSGFSKRIDIWADNVYGIPGWCGGLWDNLKRFADCVPSNTYCGGLESSRIMNWAFDVGNNCNGGMIESTWYEATKNEFGSIDCL